jgi:hypothetical protein
MSVDTLGQTYSLTGSRSKYYLVLFLLWPFLSFLLALKNYGEKESKKVVYLFLTYYGLTFIIGNEFMDASRNASNLIATAALPFSDFFKIVGGMYATVTSVDIVEPLIAFIVSRFTDHHSILFAVYAAIFGFFYLKSINLLHYRYQENPGSDAWIHMAFFVAILPITAINGFRMWTATWIFFYGAYHVILNRDRKFLLVALASSLVHFSFLPANVILLIYFLAGNRNTIYLPIALVSFILPQLLSPIFQSISGFLGGALQSRYITYSSEGYILERQESLNQSAWFLQFGDKLAFYYLLLAIIVIQLMQINIMKEKKEKNLYSFLLLFLSFVNFGKGIPSFGGRFQVVFFLFATLYIFLYFIKLTKKRISMLTWTGLFPMLLYAALVFRQGSESINAWIFTPGIGIPLLAPPLTIYDLLFR